MVVCLESKDYVQIRNALLVLIKILPHFPVIIKLAQIIEKTIDKVQKEEKNQRQDLHILATSYGGYLKAKTPQMVRESDFHQVQVSNFVNFVLSSVSRDSHLNFFFFVIGWKQTSL